MKDRMHKSILCLGFLFLLVITYGVIGLVATETVQGEAVIQVIYSGNGTITNNGIYKLASDFTGTITIENTLTEVKIIGNGSEHQHTNTNIVVAGGRVVPLNLTIENLNIVAASDAHGIDFGSAGSFDHKLYLSGVSKVHVLSLKAGIHVPNSFFLTIDSTPGIAGEIHVTGGAYGAGIGGGNNGTGGTVTINGGTVTATGGGYAAGIGGGYLGVGGTVTINGGTVTATGSSYGAGIGGAYWRAGGTVTINGGTVTAIGGGYGAGIGGGLEGAGGTVTINGGAVTATGGVDGAGIGGAASGAGGTVSIRGINTIVTARGKGSGSDIGSGRSSSAGGTLEVLEGASVDINNTNAQIKLSLRDFSADPEGGVDAFNLIKLVVSIDAVFFETPNGHISFKVNGVEVGSSSIVPEEILHGTARIDIDNLPVGTHTFSAEYVSGGDRFFSTNQLAINNYVISKTNQAPLTFNIPATITYGDEPFDIQVSGGSGTGNISYEVTSGNAVAVDNVGRITIVGAGEAEVTATKAEDDNYNEASVSIVIEVNKATPSVTFPTAITTSYGQTLSDSELISGVGDGGFAWKEPNTIPIVQNQGYTVVFTPTNGQNYVELEQTVGVIVTPKPLTIGAEDKSKVYGEEDPELTYEITAGELIGTDEISGFLIREEGEDVGSYEIQQGDLTAGANYTITFSEATLTITPRTLFITADDKSKFYIMDDPEFTVSYEGFVFADNTTNLGGELVITRTSGEEVGTYTITPSGLTSDNYHIEYVPGVLTILINNALLNSLIINNVTISPAFAPEATSYTASVGNSVSSVAVTATADYAGASITVNDEAVNNGQASNAIPLRVGSNTISVVVTEEDRVTIVYTITITRFPAPDGNGGGGEVYVPPSSPQPAFSNEKHITTVKIVTEEGKQRHTVTVQTQTMNNAVQNALEAGMSSLNLIIEEDSESPAEQIEFSAPAAALLNLSENNISLQITTALGALELPHELLLALSAQGVDLKIEIERMSLEEGEEDRQLARGAGGQPLGDSIRIKANITGNTLVNLSLAGVELPADPTERQSFLETLAVFVHHSDDRTETIAGEISYDDEGNPVGISIWVDRFSVFTMVKVPQKTILLTVGSEKALVDGVATELDAIPFIKQPFNRTLVPVRFVSEMLGADVQWLPETRQVLIRDRGREILLAIDSQTVLVDGKEEQLDCPAEIAGNRTFVPLRFVSETLGAQVEWDAAARSITINR